MPKKQKNILNDIVKVANSALSTAYNATSDLTKLLNRKIKHLTKKMTFVNHELDSMKDSVKEKYEHFCEKEDCGHGTAQHKAHDTSKHNAHDTSKHNAHHIAHSDDKSKTVVDEVTQSFKKTLKNVKNNLKSSAARDSGTKKKKRVR